jgi:hypothetical protein
MAQNHENYQTRLDFIRGLLRERYHLEVSGLEDIIPSYYIKIYILEPRNHSYRI